MRNIYKIGIALIMVSACLLLVLGTVGSEKVSDDNHDGYTIDNRSVFDGFYLDLKGEDRILISHWTSNEVAPGSYDVTTQLQSVTSGGDYRTIRMYSDKERTNEVAYRLPIINILRSEGFHIISFVGYSDTSSHEIARYASAYAEMHPEKTGIQPIPSFWHIYEYYWLDDETGQLHYIPLNSTLYDFDNRILSSNTNSNVIGCSAEYVYYNSYSSSGGLNGVIRTRVVDGEVENQKLFDDSIFNFEFVTKNDILLASDVAVFPNGKRVDIPDGYNIIDGLLCKDIKYLNIDNWADIHLFYNRYLSVPVMNGYPICADYLSANGEYVHREYSESESKQLMEESAYRHSTGIKMGTEGDQYMGWEFNLFDISDHKYYSQGSMVDFNTPVSNDHGFTVSNEPMGLDNVYGHYYNWYVVCEDSNLYLYDVLSESKYLVCDDLYKVTYIPNEYRGIYNEFFSYIDNQYNEHNLYLGPDGIISEDQSRCRYIFV